MTRAKILMLGVALAMVTVFVAPAGAQDGPSITIEPSSVEAAGEQEFTITGSGWTAAPPIFVLPCFGATNPEDLAAAGADACDTAALTPATPTDGSFTVTVTYDVPAEGMCVAAGDAAQSESGGGCITVGAAPEESATADESTPAESATASEASGEDLADTGVESGLIAIIGVAVVAAGAMLLSSTRRMGRI